jgi:hypothetical protein
VTRLCSAEVDQVKIAADDRDRSRAQRGGRRAESAKPPIATIATEGSFATRAFA